MLKLRLNSKLFMVIGASCLVVMAVDVTTKHSVGPRNSEGYQVDQKTSKPGNSYRRPAISNSKVVAKPAIAPLNARNQPTHGIEKQPNKIQMFDDMMARYRSGDPTLTGEEQAQFEQDLFTMAQTSPEHRQLLAQRLRVAINKGEVLELNMLERALVTSDEGITEIIPGFTEEIYRRGPLAPYAMQQVAQLYDWLPEENRTALRGEALAQMNNATDIHGYGGAVNYLVRSATDTQNPVSSAEQSSILAALERRRQFAQSDDEHFLTAYNLYRLSDPGQALQMARQALATSHNAGNINAAIAGLRDGSITYDTRLVAQIGDAIRLGRFTAEQMTTFSTLMSELSTSQGG